MKLIRLSADEFDAFPWQSKTRYQEQTLTLLREILVDGVPQADVAVTYGLSKQRVSSLKTEFEQLYMKEVETTSSAVVSVTLEMPVNLAIVVASFLSDMESCAKAESKTTALEQAIKALPKAAKLLKG